MDTSFPIRLFSQIFGAMLTNKITLDQSLVVQLIFGVRPVFSKEVIQSYPQMFCALPLLLLPDRIAQWFLGRRI